jgi:anti-anti-sigma factor
LIPPSPCTLQIALQRRRRPAAWAGGPAQGILVVRAAGELDRRTAVLLVRLLDHCLIMLRPEAHPADVADGQHLIVDLAEIRNFAVGGLDVVVGARHAAKHANVQLYLTGLAARRDALPLKVARLLDQIHSFPTIEQALSTLTGRGEKAPERTGNDPPPQRDG